MSLSQILDKYHQYCNIIEEALVAVAKIQHSMSLDQRKFKLWRFKSHSTFDFKLINLIDI
jgi:hypothetical protein